MLDLPPRDPSRARSPNSSVTSIVQNELTCTLISRGERRRREIRAAAERVFFELGFARTTMQAIAVRAGASKETLYRYFGSKEELFAEIVGDRAQGFLEDLDGRFEQAGAVADVLKALGLKLLDTMMDTDALRLCRIVIAGAPRNAELGIIFLRNGPDRVHLRLSAFIRTAVERGELRCDDPDCAARIFLGAVITILHLSRLVLQEPPALPRGKLHAHVDEVVAMFMSRYTADLATSA